MRRCQLYSCPGLLIPTDNCLYISLYSSLEIRLFILLIIVWKVKSFAYYTNLRRNPSLTHYLQLYLAIVLKQFQWITIFIWASSLVFGATRVGRPCCRDRDGSSSWESPLSQLWPQPAYLRDPKCNLRQAYRSRRGSIGVARFQAGRMLGSDAVQCRRD